MARFPWLKLRKKTDPDFPLEPPIRLGNCSNGEFFHEETARERKIRWLILEAADEKSRHLGIDCREFLASTMGMATSLSVLNVVSGCGTSPSSGSTSSPNGGADGGGEAGGGYNIPDAATLDCGLADQILGGSDFILDLQTHHIQDEATWTQRHPGQTYTGEAFGSALTFYVCGLMDKAMCIGWEQYVDLVFMNSDTSVAVLSGFPSAMCDDGTLCTNLNANEDMVFSRDRINHASGGGAERIVQHCQVAPNDKWDLQAAMMEEIRSKYGNHGWKCYPPWGPDGTGWWLDDEMVSSPFIDKAVALGEPLICIHKGFPLPGFDAVHSDPKDVGPAAARYPNVNFVIYHSAYETSHTEGAYDPNGGGVDRLVKTVEDNGLKGKNVYAEMGSVWALLMNSPDEAQHYVGKILKYLGEDRLVWGSECVWFGSPQPQIEAFRTFEISQANQDMYGYPALTPEIKAKIFGLTASKLYHIDPMASRCALDKSLLARLKLEHDGEFGGRRWAVQQLPGPRTRGEFLQLQRLRKFLRQPA